VRAHDLGDRAAEAFVLDHEHLVLGAAAEPARDATAGGDLVSMDVTPGRRPSQLGRDRRVVVGPGPCVHGHLLVSI
jgi:hypothetical protein